MTLAFLDYAVLAAIVTGGSGLAQWLFARYIPSAGEKGQIAAALTQAENTLLAARDQSQAMLQASRQQCEAMLESARIQAEDSLKQKFRFDLLSRRQAELHRACEDLLEATHPDHARPGLWDGAYKTILYLTLTLAPPMVRDRESPMRQTMNIQQRLQELRSALATPAAADHLDLIWGNLRGCVASLEEAVDEGLRQELQLGPPRARPPETES